MDILRKKGIILAEFYICPHFIASCNCRKPNIGLFEKATSDLSLDISSSWMMGDILNDVEAGNRIGCRTILVDNGSETEWRITQERCPHFIASTFKEATHYILSL
jgi:histidinol-phosphate phosphatase family protein